MKFLNLAVSAAIGLAATVASAAPPIPLVYDAYPLAGGGVNFFVPAPPPLTVCAGDVMRLVGKPPANNPSGPAMLATDTWDTIRVLFVATAPGTYGVRCQYFSGYTFPNPLQCAICAPPAPGTVTIPAGGAFPSVWQVTFCFGPTPIGNNDQAIVVGTLAAAGTNTINFVPAFSNRTPGGAAPAGSDFPPNGFLFDLPTVNPPAPRDCVLTPPGEFVTFGAAPAMWNLAAQIATTGCVPPPATLSLCGNTDGHVVSVERVSNMSAVEAKPVVSTRIDTKL